MLLYTFIFVCTHFSLYCQKEVSSLYNIDIRDWRCKTKMYMLHKEYFSCYCVLYTNQLSVSFHVNKKSMQKRPNMIGLHTFLSSLASHYLLSRVPRYSLYLRWLLILPYSRCLRRLLVLRYPPPPSLTSRSSLSPLPSSTSHSSLFPLPSPASRSSLSSLSSRSMIASSTSVKNAS